MNEYQCWALDATGELLHAGIRELPRVGPSTVRRYIADWEAWADTIAKQYPDCPTAQHRRRTASVCFHPVGSPDLPLWFDKRGCPLA